MQMVWTDEENIYVKNALECLTHTMSVIEICSPFQFPAPDVAGEGRQAVHAEGQRRPHLREH